jgi:hypothetical protein
VAVATVSANCALEPDEETTFRDEQRITHGKAVGSMASGSEGSDVHLAM